MRINPPQVTGISPNNGPPGTKFIIRGENLGINIEDVISLRVAGVECISSVEWKTPNKLVATTGAVTTRGDIVVTTSSGGMGSSTVYFTGEFVAIGPLQESVIWVDESDLFSTSLGEQQLLNQQYEDPLGLTFDNTNTKSQNINLKQLYKGGTGDITKDNFVSSWFLLESHQHTSFDDLKSGLEHLQQCSIHFDEGPQAFVKTNLSNFMDCYNTLSDVNTRILNDRMAYAGVKENCDSEHTIAAAKQTCITNNLLAKLQEANLHAGDLFKDVLRKKDRAEQTRTGLCVIKRFKWLFNLPHLIDSNIEKGEYDIIISDINRANTLEEIIRVDVFQRVYAEIRRKREKFRVHLNDKLLILPQTLDSQKRIIRYLMQLEDTNDPAWQCICNMHQWILNKLSERKHPYIEQENTMNSSIYKQEIKLNSNLVYQLDTNKAPSRPPRVMFVKDITQILQVTLPDIYRLGQAYLSGKLYKEAKNMQAISNDRDKAFKTILLDIMDLFTRLVRAALLPRSLDSLNADDRAIYGHWSNNAWSANSASENLIACVRYHRTCLQITSSLELLPYEANNQFEMLLFDLRSHCFTCLMQHAIISIKELHTREMWKIDTNDEIGAITLLPAIYERVVCENVQQAAEIVNPTSGQKHLFQSGNLQPQITKLTAELLQSFSCTLAYLGQKDFVIKMNAANATQLSKQFVADILLNWDKRLPIVIDNTRYVCSEILPRLLEVLRKHEYPDLDYVVKVTMDTFRSLERKLFASYTELKSTQIIGRLEQEMYIGSHDWKKCRKPIDIQNYLKEAILGVTTVHADVYAISPNLVNETLLKVIEAVIEEISRLLHCVQEFNRYGTIQARIDMQVIKQGISMFTNKRTNKLFDDCITSLPALQWPEDEKYIKQISAKCSKRLSFQFKCFQVL